MSASVPRSAIDPLRRAPLHALDRLGERQRERLLRAREEDETRPAERLVCAACGAPVTLPEHRTEVAGAHRHTFANPLGLVFDIRCFREAEGCAEIGEATEAHTWFPGFAWRVGVCGRCGVHLGWGYHGTGADAAAAAFFGLIEARVVAPH